MTRKLRSNSASLFLLLLLFTWLSFQAVQGQTVFDAFCDTVNKVFEDNKDSIVRVKAIQGQGEFVTYGTGFYIDNKGTILTASPILGPSDQVMIETNGLSLPARILSRDPRSGVVLLKVFNGTTPYLRMGDSSELKTASPVIGLGFPLNLPIAPTYGMITGFDCQYLNRIFCTTHLRTSMAISPGQIGGPVLNTRGELVGMIVMAADERKFTYALPLKAIQKVLTDIAMHGGARHGWVGAGVEEEHFASSEAISTSLTGVKSAISRVKISMIFENTPAAASGLKPGDVVVRIGNHDISRPADVIDASFFAEVGQAIPVVVERDGKEITYKFILGERPLAMPRTEENIPEAERPRAQDPVNVSYPTSAH